MTITGDAKNNRLPPSEYCYGSMAYPVPQNTEKGVADIDQGKESTLPDICFNNQTWQGKCPSTVRFSRTPDFLHGFCFSSQT